MKYSECCGSPIKFHDICSGCGEHCDEVVKFNCPKLYFLDSRELRVLYHRHSLFYH